MRWCLFTTPPNRFPWLSLQPSLCSVSATTQPAQSTKLCKHRVEIQHSTQKGHINHWLSSLQFLSLTFSMSVYTTFANFFTIFLFLAVIVRVHFFVLGVNHACTYPHRQHHIILLMMLLMMLFMEPLSHPTFYGHIGTWQGHQVESLLLCTISL